MGRSRGRLGARLGWALAVTVLAGHALGGCAEGNACKTNSDCGGGYCGPGGTCKTDCKIDIDCPRGTFCNSLAQCEPDTGGAGAAGAAPTDGGAATGGAPATGGAAATGGAPATGGMAGSTATGGSSGASGASGMAGTGAGPATGGGAGMGSGGTGGIATGGTGGGTGGTGGVAGTKREFDTCTSDNDCRASLICRAIYKGGPNQCTRRCSNTAECMQSTRCELFGADRYCAISDVGRSCTQASDCAFACELSKSYCTSTCVDGGDCPAGWGCQPLGTAGQRVCIKASAACDVNTNDCIVPAACDTTMLVSSCTLACSTAADCPRRSVELTPWTCNGICKRPPDIFGPLAGGTFPAQWACDPLDNVVNICGDGLHVDFGNATIPAPPSFSCPVGTSVDGRPGDACVDSCLLDSGCPFGFVCTAIGTTTGSNRFGLCFPGLGGSPIGTACSNGAECFFGYCSNGVCSRDCTIDGLCPDGATCIGAGGPAVESAPFRRCM